MRDVESRLVMLRKVRAGDLEGAREIVEMTVRGDAGELDWWLGAMGVLDVLIAAEARRRARGK